MFINGLPKPVTGAIFNVFDILKGLREEVQRLTALSSLPTSPSIRKEVVRLAATAGAAEGGREEGGGGEVRLDIYRGAKGALVYLNNIEKDRQYQRWPSTLRQLLYPSWQLQALSRNLYTLTLVLDLADASSLRALATMRDLYERTFPVRFSVVMVSKEGEGEEGVVGRVQEMVKGGREGGREGAKATSEVVGMLFHHAKEAHGLEAAVAFQHSKP